MFDRSARHFFMCVLAGGLLMHAGLCLAQSASAPASRPSEKTISIVLAGDSTVTDKSGWGQGFARMLTDRAQCTNTAIGGRSSKSFRDEGRWDKALALKGDYVLIQFGHNDEPGKGPGRETDPDTTYYANMSRYVDEVRAAGGKPVLVSSLARRVFDADGNIRSGNLLRYVQAVRKVAAEKQVPLIDLYALSVAYYQQHGAAGCADIEPSNKGGGPDHTHLNEHGGDVFGAIIAGELRKIIPELTDFIKQ